ncbi:MAG: RNA polymerase sigma factor region1.1 domain-containing protein, partial [Chloroflexaceae bacterium]
EAATDAAAAPEAPTVADADEPETAGEPEAAGEPELTPFSLDDLGLSEEEIAALDMSGEAATDAAGPESATAPEISEPEGIAEEAEATPFSLDDLGLDSDASETDTPGEPESAQPDLAENFGNLQPFSLADLGLSDDEIASLSLGTQNDSELGLTEEELAGLDIGTFGDMTPSLLRPQSDAQSPRAGTPAPPEPEESTGDPTIDRLINLGRRQGFVDLNDIIDVVENPMSQPERIEEIGQALHHAGIEIRDGDEVIDMEEISGEDEYPEAFDSPDIEEPAGGDEPELMPFSLSDLGLSEEEIAALGLDEGGVASTEAAPADEAMEAMDMPEEAAPAAPAQPAAGEEPELTPFSLSDLGLSEEEIAALEASGSGEVAPEEPGADVPEPEPSEPAATTEEPELSPFSLSDLGLSAEEIAALSSAASQAASESTPRPEAPAIEETDAFDFSVVEEHREEIAKPVKRTEPRPEEEEPTVSAEDAEFVAPPLEALDDIWSIADTTTEKPREEPARVTLEPTKPAQRAKEPRRESGRSTAAQRTPDRRSTAAPRTEEKARTAPPREKERKERKEPAATPATATSWRKKLESFIPTGDETLDEYLRQSQSEPDNHGLHLAIARLSAQTGRAELAAYQYKRLIKEKVALEQIVDDLQDLVEDTEDRHLLQRLHRLLGDAYSAQNRFREAIAEYSWTFSN